jgi:heme exporter protein D
MIQRVQTIYLVIVKLFAILFLFLPLGKIINNTEAASVSLLSINEQDYFGAHIEYVWLRYVVIAIAVMILALTVVVIFSYKNRRKQIKFDQMNLILHILLISMAFFYVDFIKAYTELPFNFGIAIIFPIISMVLILIANRAIKKDEKLVRSTDRLR